MKSALQLVPVLLILCIVSAIATRESKPRPYPIRIRPGTIYSPCRTISCPEDVEDQYFPHPTRCDAFCQCSNGLPYEMPCPPGLVFYPGLNVCVMPEDYDCRIGKKGCESVKCPDDREQQYFPHPGRCDAFCQCSNWVPYEMLCPLGLVFNPNINVCVYKSTYECKV